MKPVLIRLEDEEHRQFREACEERRESMQDAGAKLLRAYLANHRDRSIRHLNGEMCPVQALIDALATTTRAELERR
jgi:hypothetical protein